MQIDNPASFLLTLPDLSGSVSIQQFVEADEQTLFVELSYINDEEPVTKFTRDYLSFTLNFQIFS